MSDKKTCRWLTVRSGGILLGSFGVLINTPLLIFSFYLLAKIKFLLKIEHMDAIFLPFVIVSIFCLFVNCISFVFLIIASLKETYSDLLTWLTINKIAIILIFLLSVGIGGLLTHAWGIVTLSIMIPISGYIACLGICVVVLERKITKEKNISVYRTSDILSIISEEELPGSIITLPVQLVATA